MELVGEGRRGGQRDSVVHGAGRCAKRIVHKSTARADTALRNPGGDEREKLARYGQAFKNRAVARLLPPESVAPEVVAREIGVSADTLVRWRSQALAEPAGERLWTASARLEAVIATAALDEAARGAWCREHGVYPQQLQQWRDNATQALAEPEEVRASPQQTRQDRRRIKELKRELRRKDKALAETAALLVLSKKVEAIFNKGEDE